MSNFFLFQLQETAFEFGKNIGFAHQLKKDLQALLEEKSTTILHTAPVIISSKQTEVKTLIMQILLEKNTEKLDHLLQELSSIASQGETLTKMKDLSLDYGEKALQSLQLFPDSDAKQALINIANSCTLQG